MEIVLVLRLVIWFGYVAIYGCMAHESDNHEIHVHVVIGVIRNGEPHFDINTSRIETYNVSVFNYSVDYRQPYNIFRAAHLLEKHHSADVIAFIHDVTIETSLATLASLSTTRVEFGRRPSFSNQYVFQTAADDPSLCPIVKTSNATKLFCYSEEQVIDIQKNTNNETMIIGTVDVRPPAILATIIVKAMLCTTVFIFHETSTEFDAGELVDELSKNDVKVIVFNADVEQNIQHVLYRYYRKTVPIEGQVDFVVLCRLNCLRRIFSIVSTFDTTNGRTTLLKQFSRWFVAMYDNTQDVTATLKSCAYQLDNLAVIAFPKIADSYPEQRFESDVEMSVRSAIVEETEFHESDNETESPKRLKDGFIHAFKNIAVSSTRGAQCSGLRIETLMWAKNSRYFDSVGLVNNAGNVIIRSALFPNTKFGYNMRTFNVSTLHYSPFVIIKEYANGTITYGGICMDLLRELALTLNFTYTLTGPDDSKWGSPIEGKANLTFNGMIGQLQREEVDIVAADISIQKEREMVMDFMFPFFYGDTSVMLKKPDPNIRKWRTLLDPFKEEVLLCIGIVLPLASLLAFLLEKFNPFYSDPENARLAKETYGLHTFHDSFWYMYSALLSQGGVNLPESNAGRTFVSCWWLFCIVIVGIYCGNLIAFLTVSREKSPFNTLDEMADLKGEYRWGLQAGTHWEYVFKHSTRGEFRRVGDILFEYNRTDPTVMSTDVRVHINKVKEGYYGWIGDTVIIEMEMAKDCELMMIKDRFLPLKYAFGFTNNSPHVQIFSKQMLSIHESGILQVWKRRWWPKSNAICAGSIVTEAKPITVIDVQSAFYVAAGGAVIGGLAFGIEILVGKFKRYKKRLKECNGNVNRNKFAVQVTKLDAD